MMRAFRCWISALLLMGTAGAALNGCGGGTTGTDNGGGGAEFRGLVLDAANRPVADAAVAIAETGDETITDSAGAFELRSSFNGESPHLIFDRGTRSHTLVIDAALSAASLVELTVQLFSDGTLTVVRQRITDNIVPDPSSSLSPSPRPTSDTTPAGSPAPQQPADSIFRGTVRLSTGGPLVGARVSISDGHSTDITDRNGEFSILRASRAGSAVLTIALGAVSKQVTISGLPARSIIDTLELEVVLATIPAPGATPAPTSGPNGAIGKGKLQVVRSTITDR